MVDWTHPSCRSPRQALTRASLAAPHSLLSGCFQALAAVVVVVSVVGRLMGVLQG